MSVNIKQSGSLKKIAAFLPNNLITVSSLPDTDITNIQAGQSLVYDGELSKWVNYSAKIVVTYTDSFKGETITCTKGLTVISKTAPLDSNTLIFYVSSVGTWVVTGGDFSVSVTIDNVGDVKYAELLSVPEGATVEPTDDIQIWLACANLDKPYTTLDAVLADRETFETLIADSNACDYMARSTSWAGVTGGLVPTMTSNTTPSGTCSASSQGNGQEAWRAFDRNSSDFWNSTQSSAPVWLQYEFAQNTKVNVAEIQFTSYSTSATVQIQKADGTPLSESVTISGTTKTRIPINSDGSFADYRLYISSHTKTSSYAGVCQSVQFYYEGITTNADAMALIGKYDYCSNALLGNSTWCEAIANSDYFESILNVKIPVMTSNTAPSGTCSASSSLSSSYPAWHGFSNGTTDGWIPNGVTGWIQYEFPMPVKACVFTEYNHITTNRPSTVSIEISEDGTNFTQIKSGISILGTNGFKAKELLENTFTCKYYRINATGTGSASGTDKYPWLGSLNFYCRASKEVLVPLVPTMTSDTTPSGECSASTVTSGGYDAWRAFDGNDSTNGWCPNISTSSLVGTWIKYAFPNQVKVDRIRALQRDSASTDTTYKLEASNDDTNWTTISDSLIMTKNSVVTFSDVTTSAKYRYYRITMLTNTVTGTCRGFKFQFYEKAVQTNIVHSCANDTIYYMEDGSPVIVATTNNDGYGILDFSSLEDKEYTFYSSVAKDPSNLSNDFSKTIRITKSEFGGTTEMYLMPDTVKTLYWWGYESDNLEDCTSANGWSIYTATLVAPTHNTNSIRCNPNNSNLYIAGVGNKTATSSSTTLAFIYQGITVVSNIYGELTYGNSKNLSSSYSQRYINSSSIAKDTQALSSGQYCCIQASRTRSIDIYAIWYE